jgi:hypothetical protein
MAKFEGWKFPMNWNKLLLLGQNNYLALKRGVFYVI